MDRATAAERITALTRLALAVGYRLPEASEDRRLLYRVFLEDTDRFSTETFVAACRALESTAAFWPKKSELIEACRMISQRRLEAVEAERRKALPPAPISAEQHADLMARLRRALGRK